MSHFFRGRPSRVITSAVVILMAAGCYYSQTSPGSLAGGPTELTIPHVPAPNARDFYPHGISFSPDGRKLASAEGDGSIRVLDAATGNTLMTLKAYEGAPERNVYYDLKTSVPRVLHFGARKIRFSPDGKWLASVNDDSTLRIWDATTGTEVHKIHIHGYLNHLTWSPDSRRLATPSPDGIVTLWDAATGKQISSFSIFSTQRLASRSPRRGPMMLKEILFTPAGQLLAETLEDGIQLWDPSSGRRIRSFALWYWKKQMSLCCNGKKLAVVNGIVTTALIPSVKEWAFLLDLETGKSLTLGKSAYALTPFAISPDGSKVAFTVTVGHFKTWTTQSSYQYSIRVYSVGQKRIIRTFGAEDPLIDLAFSPDSKLLAASGKTIRIWRFGQ